MSEKKKEDLRELIEQNQFSWVKDELFPLFGLLNVRKEIRNGYFSLPLSKENIIRNLHRISGKHRIDIEKELDKFERTVGNRYIEEESKEYAYDTGSTRRNHSSIPKKCQEPYLSEIFYYLDPHLMEISLKALNKLEFNSQEIVSEIIQNVKTNNDLLWLHLLKRITEECVSKRFYRFDEEAKKELRTLMESINIDEEFIDYCLGIYASPFELNYEKISFEQKFLPKNQKCFAVFYSHGFNTNSCRRRNNIIIRTDIANKIFKKIDKVPIDKMLAKRYDEIKLEMSKDEKKIPFFEHKDYRFRFMEKYYSKLKNKNFYEFEIDEEDYKKALSFIKEKDIVQIENDEIILKDEEKFDALYVSLRERENSRINKNKLEIFHKWLKSKVDLSKDIEFILTSTEQEIQKGTLKQKAPQKEEKFNIKQIKVRRGGAWTVEGNQSVFLFKVKVKNDSKFVVTNVQIILNSIPNSLEVKSDRQIINVLNPNSFQSPTFKLIAKESCVGDRIRGIVIFTNPKDKPKTIEIAPFDITYVCNLLVPKQITNQEYDLNVKNMERNELILDCDMSPDEVEQELVQILQKNNFYLLKTQPELGGEQFRQLKGYAEGKYDKEDVALSIIIKEITMENTKLIIEAMSRKEEKLIDLLKDLSVRCDDIKSDTELIKEYSSQIEEIFDKTENLEEFLKDHLTSDWEKIKNSWQEYKTGKINRKQLIARSVKAIGIIFVNKIIGEII